MTLNDERMYYRHGEPESRMTQFVGFLFTEFGRWALVLCDTKVVRMIDACILILREPK